MDTNPNGSVPLDVNTGAAAIMGLMGGEEGEQPTPEAQEEQIEQTEAVEQEVEETPRYRVKAAGEEVEVRKILENQLLKEGFIVNQFTSNLVYPETFKTLDSKSV